MILTPSNNRDAAAIAMGMMAVRSKQFGPYVRLSGNFTPKIARALTVLRNDFIHYPVLTARR